MNSLAQFLMSQRPGTIANPAQLSPAQYQTDILKAQRDQELADQMMHQGYVQNSGGLGVLASALSTLVGAKLGQNANDTLSTALQSKFEDDNKAAQAKRAQDLADEERKYQRDIEKAQKEAEAKAKAEAANRGPMNVAPGGVVFDPVSGKPVYTAPRAEPAPRAPTEIEQKIKLAQQYGATPEQIQTMVLGASASNKPKEQPAEVRNKLALIDNAIANATEYQKRVVGPDGSFADITSMTGDTPQLMQSAVQDMLYAKSGASAPAEEVAKAMAMYSPSRIGGVIPTERDSTAAAKVGNFINDMKRMRAEIAGDQGAQGQATSAPSKPGSPIPAGPGVTGNPLIDKYLRHP